MRLFGSTFFFLVLVSVVPALADDTTALKSLLDDSWEFGLQESPTFATHVGDHRFNDQLSHETIADQQRRLAKYRECLARLKGIDRAKLTKTDGINYDIFQRILNNDIAE
ncbi:MAG TPA: hypothetical protein P5307_25160, partial [Pirellulaceae bacterium]|nr:hypothetical protein [Pirellulaceae bacterium]